MCGSIRKARKIAVIQSIVCYAPNTSASTATAVSCRAGNGSRGRRAFGWPHGAQRRPLLGAGV